MTPGRKTIRPPGRPFLPWPMPMPKRCWSCSATSYRSWPERRIETNPHGQGLCRKGGPLHGEYEERLCFFRYGHGDFLSAGKASCFLHSRYDFAGQKAASPGRKALQGAGRRKFKAASGAVCRGVRPLPPCGGRAGMIFHLLKKRRGRSDSAGRHGGLLPLPQA